MVESEENVDSDADMEDLVVEDNEKILDLEKEVDEADTSNEKYRTSRDKGEGAITN